MRHAALEEADELRIGLGLCRIALYSQVDSEYVARMEDVLQSQLPRGGRSFPTYRVPTRILRLEKLAMLV